MILHNSGTLSAAAVEPNAVTRIAGYAAVFNSYSSDLGGFKEIIRPGAFKQSLAGGVDVRALWNHNNDLVLGRLSAGTLRLREDSKGLFFDLSPPDTQAGRDAIESIRRGDVTGCSFGFRVPRKGDSWRLMDGERIREIHDADIFELSICAFPAYQRTEVGIRMASPQMETAACRLRLLESDD
ncbi:MAG TPA: HK97 family phage prohead protease [Pirellulales bacterium]|jgi:hypothetical protein